MNCESDSYGSAFRASLKRSMEYPAMKPTFTCMSPNTAPLGTKPEKRGRGLGKRIRRLWWHWGDAIGMYLWIIVGLMVSTGFWFVFIGLEDHFRGK